jgi:hypothetical protein
MLHELARRLPEWNGSPTDIQGGPVARGWEMILRVANEEIRVVAPSEALAIAELRRDLRQRADTARVRARYG